jgi:hypothetical protein
MHQDAWRMAPEQRIAHDDDGDDRQRPADGAPRRLQQHDNEHAAHGDVDGQRVADPERQVVEGPRHVEHRDDGRQRQQPVVQRHAARPPYGGIMGPVAIARRGGEDEEDEPQHEGHVHAAVRDLAQQAEAGGVVMERRQREEQQRHQPGDPRPQGSEANLRVELLFEPAPLVVRGHEGLGGHLPSALRPVMPGLSRAIQDHRKPAAPAALDARRAGHDNVGDRGSFR